MCAYIRVRHRAGAREEWNVRSTREVAGSMRHVVPILARMTSRGGGGVGLSEAMIRLTVPRVMSRSSLTFPDARRVYVREERYDLPFLAHVTYDVT